MAKRKEPKKAKDIKLRQPDRSGPTEATLLNLANERGLFDAADAASKRPTGANDDDDDLVLSPRAERILEAVLWTVTMGMLHFTFDVLVQYQYGTQVRWGQVCLRTARAWAFFLLLFWPLHPHPSNQVLLPSLPLRYQKPLRQAIFFAMSTASGCYLIYISNEFSYLSIMKQAPPLGCLWLWAVVELDLLWAVPSLAIAAGYMWKEGYSVK